MIRRLAALAALGLLGVGVAVAVAQTEPQTFWTSTFVLSGPIPTVIETVTTTATSTETTTVTVTAPTTTSTTPTTTTTPAPPTCTAEASPGASVAAFVNALPAGAVGCLHGGTYSGSVTITRGGVTLRSYPGERATISGNLTITDAADGLVLQSLNLVGGSGFSLAYIYGDSVTLLDLDVSGGGVRNCLLVGEGAEATPGNRVDDLLIDRSRIHHCGNDSHEHAIYAEFTERMVIRDSYLYASGGYGLHFYPEANDSLVEYSVIDGNDTGTGWAANITFSGEQAGGEYSVVHRSDRNVIRNSLVTFASPAGASQNVVSYWPGGIGPGVGNAVQDSCVWSPGDAETAGDGGFAMSNITRADPQYANRAGGDFTLAPGSPCAGKGPR